MKERPSIPMFSFIKTTLKKIYASITSQLSALFSTTKVDTATLDQLERILFESDAGVEVTRTIIAELRKELQQGSLATGADLQHALRTKLITLLHRKQYQSAGPVYLFVGVNGSGKTTSVAKLAQHLGQQGKRVLLVAADTFRAAATQQLSAWAEKLGVDLITGGATQDPSAVIYAACKKFALGEHDVLIIDTAGRLQTKANLMKELEKIGTVIRRQLPSATTTTLLTIDAMLGQNSLDQARLFHQSTALDGIILTKMDGTAKGGIVFAIMKDLEVPVAYITFGEQADQIRPFAAQDFVEDLVNP